MTPFPVAICPVLILKSVALTHTVIRLVTSIVYPGVKELGVYCGLCWCLTPSPKPLAALYKGGWLSLNAEVVK